MCGLSFWKNLKIVFHSAFTSSCPPNDWQETYLCLRWMPAFEKWLLKPFVLFTSYFWLFLQSCSSSLYFSLIVYQVFLPCSRLTFYTFDCFFTVRSNLYFHRPICVFFIPLSALLLLLIKIHFWTIVIFTLHGTILYKYF